MLIIKVGKDKGDIEKALRAYKNKVRKTKLIDNIRDREEFVKPCVKRRKQKRKASYIEKKYRQGD